MARIVIQDLHHCNSDLYKDLEKSMIDLGGQQLSNINGGHSGLGDALEVPLFILKHLGQRLV